MSADYIDEQSGKPKNPEVDSIWLTPGSVKPILLAFAILCSLLGLFAFRPLMIAALVAIAVIGIAWINESRDESDELPLN